MKTLFLTAFFVTALTVGAMAQNSEVRTTARTNESVRFSAVIAANSTKVVKGAPFSAEGVSESVQVLPDGNKITRTNTTKMYRDSDGRFRREGAGGTNNSNISAVGGFFPVSGIQDMISIYDPVEAVRYVLNPLTKSARKSVNQTAPTEESVIVNGQLKKTMTYTAQIPASAATKQQKTIVNDKANIVLMPSFSGKLTNGKIDQLGTKSIEGIETTGTKTVMTIDAGTIGNERPIEIVYERWYSKELDLIVQSRNYDPRFGEQTYRLTNINRSEPDRSLFSVPADYKIETGAVTFYTTMKKR